MIDAAAAFMLRGMPTPMPTAASPLELDLDGF
jgi:hypothetical protein